MCHLRKLFQLPSSWPLPSLDGGLGATPQPTYSGSHLGYTLSFVLHSHRSSPQSIWQVDFGAQLLTPLPPMLRFTRMSSGVCVFCTGSVPWNATSRFYQILESFPRQAKASQKAPGASKRRPKGFQIAPAVLPGGSKGARKSPKGNQNDQEYKYMYIYIYIYIRTYVCMFTQYIYDYYISTYVYKERERDRERERSMYI